MSKHVKTVRLYCASCGETTPHERYVNGTFGCKVCKDMGQQNINKEHKTDRQSFFKEFKQ